MVMHAAGYVAAVHDGNPFDSVEDFDDAQAALWDSAWARALEMMRA